MAVNLKQNVSRKKLIHGMKLVGMRGREEKKESRKERGQKKYSEEKEGRTLSS